MGKAAKLRHIIESEIEPEIVRIGNTRYRVGFCSQCGACCKYVHMDTKGPQVAIDWLELHNVRVTKIGDIKSDPREEAREFTLSLAFPCQCKALKLDEDTSKYHCDIYEERPVVCKMYPKTYTGFATCTYVFVSDEELNKFARDYTKYWREKHGKEKEIHITT